MTTMTTTMVILHWCYVTFLISIWSCDYYLRARYVSPWPELNFVAVFLILFFKCSINNIRFLRYPVIAVYKMQVLWVEHRTCYFLLGLFGTVGAHFTVIQPDLHLFMLCSCTGFWTDNYQLSLAIFIHFPCMNWLWRWLKWWFLFHRMFFLETAFFSPQCQKLVAFC